MAKSESDADGGGGRHGRFVGGPRTGAGHVPVPDPVVNDTEIEGKLLARVWRQCACLPLGAGGCRVDFRFHSLLIRIIRRAVRMRAT